MVLNEPLTAVVCVADKETQMRYLQPFKWLVNIYQKKGEKKMVDIKKIEEEIEKLELLNAQEYCAEAVAKIYADFEASREVKIHEYKRALEIFQEFQFQEEQPEEFENLEG